MTLEYAVDEYFKPEFVLLTNPADAALTEANVVVKPANVANYFAAIEAKIATLGYAKDTSIALDEGDYIYTLTEGEGENAKVTSQIIFTVGKANVEIYYMAPKARITYDIPSNTLVPADFLIAMGADAFVLLSILISLLKAWCVTQNSAYSGFFLFTRKLTSTMIRNPNND